MVYVFSYTDCAGHSHDWKYTYTISVPDFTLPADSARTVNCPSDAVTPTAPTVVDACGKTLTPTVTTPSPVTCNGTMVYVFSYTDCAGHSHDWKYTYTISVPDFTLPSDSARSVNHTSELQSPDHLTLLAPRGKTHTPTVTTPS